MNKTFKASVIGLGLIASAGALAGWKAIDSAASSTTAITTAHVEGESSATRLYEIDPTHTNVIFKIRHGSVTNFYGRFNDTQGSINFDKDNIANSSMNLVVQISSIDTHNPTRDGHLKGADFFNARQYDEASFVSTGIKDAGNGKYVVTGDFTLQGKTVSISADLHDIRTGKFRDFDVLGVEARFTIKRSDFGITKYLDPKDPNKGPLGDEVEIIVAIEAVGK